MPAHSEGEGVRVPGAMPTGEVVPPRPELWSGAGTAAWWMAPFWRTGAASDPPLPQRPERVHPGGARCRQPAGDEGDGEETDGDGGVGDDVVPRDAVQQ
jgi:hypothetical protein